MTPPPAGSWIRMYFKLSGWATTRWHLFTGDMTWRPYWSEPSLDAACGYHTGALTSSETLHVNEDEPDAPCLLCLARAPFRMGS